MKKYLMILSSFLMINLTVNAQKTLVEIFKIDPFSWENHLYELTKKEEWKKKYKDSGGEVYEMVSKLKEDMPFRVKCYQVANDLKANDPLVLRLKKNMDSLLSKYQQKEKLKFKLDKRKLNSLNKEIESLTKSVDSFSCPKIKRYLGSVKAKDGFLLFDPLKRPIKDSTAISFKILAKNYRKKEELRLISYMNRDKKKFGIKLKEGEIVKVTRWGTSIGALTIPIKIYLRNSSDTDLEGTNNIVTDVNIALFLGSYFGTTGYDSEGKVKFSSDWTIGPMFGVSKLTLKPGNTNGDTVTEDIDVLSVNIGSALSRKYNQFNFFVALGVDFATTGKGKQWIFDRQPWLGFGIGYSVFK